jgi:hypothetical protein
LIVGFGLFYLPDLLELKWHLTLAPESQMRRLGRFEKVHGSWWALSSCCGRCSSVLGFPIFEAGIGDSQLVMIEQREERLGSS